ncbi:MAG: DUF2219 family protein, partial [candidate division NC10 bacterium]|nr:DUF2219 family protein [candidate division NC10 bacterium]
MVSLMALALMLSTSSAGEVANDRLSAAFPAQPRQWSLATRWENDTFSGTDRFYTNGISLWLAHTGSSWLDPFADRLPWESGRRTVSYEVGHVMVTPADISRRIP